MIRINLIGTKAKPKAKTPKLEMIVFGVMILAEVVFLFTWYQMLSSDLEVATKRTKEARAKIADLKKVKEAWERWQVEKADLDRQAKVFESLRAEQIGPPNMLQYLSYALTRLQDTPATTDEIKAQELVGWNPKWDPNRVWLTKLSEKQGMLTLKGEAVDHEDVAEFYRRLESCDYFQGIEPGLQLRKLSPELGIKYVEFTVSTGLKYTLPAAAPVAAAPAATGPPGGAPGAK